MHCVDDKANGIILNHNADWRGETRLAWYSRDPGPLPASLRECWCEGGNLITGRFALLRGDEPPLVIITRAVALAVEACLRRKMRIAIESLSIDQGRIDRTLRQQHPGDLTTFTNAMQSGHWFRRRLWRDALLLAGALRVSEGWFWQCEWSDGPIRPKRLPQNFLLAVSDLLAEDWEILPTPQHTTKQAP